MKVLITGAAGRVGGVVSRVLHQGGFDLRLTDRRPGKNLPATVEVANLLDRERCYGLLDGCEALVHLGNHPNFHGPADAQQVYIENCAMNMNVFQAALELGVKKVVFVSSIQVINGDRMYTEDESKLAPSQLKYLPLDSDTPANPRNPYSLSKRAGELLLQDYLAPQGVQAVALRLPFCALPDGWNWMTRNPSSRVRPHHLIDEALTTLHAEDFGDLVARVLRTDLPGYRCYLPAAHTPMVDVPVQELIDRLYKGVPLRRPAEELTSLVDVSRITAETGWAPKYNLAWPKPTAAEPAPQLRAS